MLLFFFGFMSGVLVGWILLKRPVWIEKLGGLIWWCLQWAYARVFG
jgi:hypothetical protein